jgi:hypothetical protein
MDPGNVQTRSWIQIDNSEGNIRALLGLCNVYDLGIYLRVIPELPS